MCTFVGKWRIRFRRESIVEHSNSSLLRRSIIQGNHNGSGLESNNILQLCPENDNNKYRMGVSIEMDGHSSLNQDPYNNENEGEEQSDGSDVLERTDDSFVDFEIAEKKSQKFTSPSMLYVPKSEEKEITYDLAATQ